MDPRFDLPLYTRAEVALHLGLPASTLGDWLRSGAIESRRGGRGEPTITFAGLVETHMLRQRRFRRTREHVVDRVRSGTSYRDVAARFSLRTSRWRPWSAPTSADPAPGAPSTRNPRQPTPTHAFLTAANEKVVGG